MTHLLSVSGLSCSFGALHVIKDINFDVREGETVGVIGPNGAGKTTLMSLIAGSQRPSKGRIAFAGQDITEYSVHERARSGLARTYQVPRPFSHMTVDQNLRVAAHFAAGDRDATERVNDVLSICGLERVRNKEAGSLPLLQRKRHELARALASNPKLLLVDEVAAGLTEREVDEFIELIGTIKSRGITVIWIEHVIRTMLHATTRLIAIDRGTIIADGAPSDVINTPEVRQVYLGIGI